MSGRAGRLLRRGVPAWRRRDGRRRGERGFTLLEVTIAGLLAALALGAVAQGGGGSLHATGLAARQAEALSRARSRLDALRAGPPQPTEQSGDDGDGYRWQSSIAPVAEARSQVLYEARVTIGWDASRAVTLTTRLVGPR